MREKNGVIAQRRELTKDMAICGLFASLIAVGAFLKIVIPVGVDTMNFTLQWLFVLLAGLLLGSKRAFYSVTTYLVIGLVGFPVFARGGGPAYLIRPTFGFLLGFAFAAYAMGKVCESCIRQRSGPGSLRRRSVTSFIMERESYIFTLLHIL